jgi:hypothetical protein
VGERIVLLVPDYAIVDSDDKTLCADECISGCVAGLGRCGKFGKWLRVVDGRWCRRCAACLAAERRAKGGAK